MTEQPPPLHLFLADPDDHAPALPEGVGGAHTPGAEAPPETGEPQYLWDEGGDPNALDAQRWAVFAPDNAEGRGMVAAVEALIQRRAEQSGHRAEPFFVPVGLTESQAHLWRKTVFEASAPDPHDLPRYQLILGDLDGVSLPFQQVMGGDAFTGRLAFDPSPGRPNPFEAYEAYADKITRWERAPLEGPGAALLHLVEDGTPSTRIGDEALITPGEAQLADWIQSGRVDASRLQVLGRGEPDPDAVLRAAAAAGPGAMLTLCHGEGAPRSGWRSPAEQRERQGALSFGRGGRLGASELRDQAFLPGGLWFLVACFGAGTPEASVYYPWLKMLRDKKLYGGPLEPLLKGLRIEGGRPFISAAPKAALASADGPLAVIGHVDLAWSYIFQEMDTGRALNRAGRIMQVMRAALAGDRLGVAYRWLSRFLGRVNDEISSLMHESSETGQPPDALRLGHLWMLRNDLSGYVLLGDPAARLPIHGPARGDTLAPEVRAVRPPVDEIERAAAALILGQAIEPLAAAAGLSPEALTVWAQRYREAGRRGLG